MLGSEKWCTCAVILIYTDLLDTGAVELRNLVSAMFGIDLSATAAFDYPTIAALARHIASQIAPAVIGLQGDQGDAAIGMSTMNAAQIVRQLQVCLRIPPL